jgi:hypothetical protein
MGVAKILTGTYRKKEHIGFGNKGFGYNGEGRV